MAAELITLPFRPVINTRGVLEPGALLDVFQSGTTTRVSVFADADLSAPLTNPVVADAAGVFPTVYFDNSAAVRVRVRRANGSVLGDADPYYSDGLSSTDLSFLQSGSGAVTRTVQAKLREFVSAEDFGAVGDGVADDTTAIQAAINAVSAAGSGIVLLSPKRYRITSLTVPSYVSLRGQSIGPFDGSSSPSSGVVAPTLLCTSTTNPAVTLNGFGSGITDVLFFYPSQVAPTAASPTVYPYTVSIPTGQGGGHVVERCTFVNSYRAVNVGVGRSGVKNCIIGAFETGINVDNCLDWVVCENNFHQVMWNVYASLSYPQNIDAWVLNNGAAMRVGRVDSLSVEGFKVFSQYIGVQFMDGTGQAPGATCGYGRLSNVDLDFVAYGVFATASKPNTGGFTISNMTLGPNASGRGTAGQSTIQLNTGGSSAPVVSWTSGGVRGSWAAGSPFPVVNAGSCHVSGVRGINDVGALTSPTVPATGVGLKNPYSIPVRLGLVAGGGAITAVNINGNGTGLAGTNISLMLMPNETIAVTYPGTLTWAWFAA